MIRKSSKVCEPGLSLIDLAASRRSTSCWTVICNGALVGLVAAAERVVAPRLAGHLDVAAHHVRDLARAGELHGPLHAVEVDGEVEREDPAGQCVVGGDQEPAPRVVDRDGRSLVPGRADDLEFASAEIELDDLVRPGGEAVELLHGLQLPIDDGGCRPVGELCVSFHVVEMAMGVSDDQLVALARVLGEPRLDDLVHGLA